MRPRASGAAARTLRNAASPPPQARANASTMPVYGAIERSTGIRSAEVRQRLGQHIGASEKLVWLPPVMSTIHPGAPRCQGCASSRSRDRAPEA